MKRELIPALTFACEEHEIFSHMDIFRGKGYSVLDSLMIIKVFDDLQSVIRSQKIDSELTIPGYFLKALADSDFNAEAIIHIINIEKERLLMGMAYEQSYIGVHRSVVVSPLLDSCIAMVENIGEFILSLNPGNAIHKINALRLDVCSGSSLELSEQVLISASSFDVWRLTVFHGSPRASLFSSSSIGKEGRALFMSKYGDRKYLGPLYDLISRFGKNPKSRKIPVTLRMLDNIKTRLWVKHPRIRPDLVHDEQRTALFIAEILDLEFLAAFFRRCKDSKELRTVFVWFFSKEISNVKGNVKLELRNIKSEVQPKGVDYVLLNSVYINELYDKFGESVFYYLFGRSDDLKSLFVRLAFDSRGSIYKEVVRPLYRHEECAVKKDDRCQFTRAYFKETTIREIYTPAEMYQYTYEDVAIFFDFDLAIYRRKGEFKNLQSILQLLLNDLELTLKVLECLVEALLDLLFSPNRQADQNPQMLSHSLLMKIFRHDPQYTAICIEKHLFSEKIPNLKWKAKRTGDDYLGILKKEFKLKAFYKWIIGDVANYLSPEMTVRLIKHGRRVSGRHRSPLDDLIDDFGVVPVPVFYEFFFTISCCP